MIFIIVLIAIVQGFCEFLPVSSSGHIVLLHKLFGLQCDIVSLNIILHCATALSVIIFYRKQIWWYIKHPLSKQTINLVIATALTCVIVIIFKPFISDAINGKFLAISFSITAVILLLATYINKKYTNIKPVTTLTAVVMGIFQGLAILPGISRSGTTLCSGLVCGSNKSEVADFSFIMSLPIIIIGAIYDFVFEKPNFAGINAFLLVLSFLVAFVCGLIAIRITKEFAEKTKLWFFSIYLFALSIVCFII